MDSSLVFVQIFPQLSTERFDIFYFKLAVVETPSPFLRLSAGLISKGNGTKPKLINDNFLLMI